MIRVYSCFFIVIFVFLISCSLENDKFIDISNNFNSAVFHPEKDNIVYLYRYESPKNFEVININYKDKVVKINVDDENKMLFYKLSKKEGRILNSFIKGATYKKSSRVSIVINNRRIVLPKKIKMKYPAVCFGKNKSEIYISEPSNKYKGSILLYLYDIRSKRIKREFFFQKTGYFDDMLISPNGKFIALSTAKYGLCIFDFSKMKFYHGIVDTKKTGKAIYPISIVNWSANSSKIIFSMDGLHVIDIKTALNSVDEFIAVTSPLPH